MKESYWGYWLVMLGIMVVGVMLLINSTTTGTTHDYYELKDDLDNHMSSNFSKENSCKPYKIRKKYKNRKYSN